MSLASACQGYVGTSNFRDAGNGAAVWFHRDAGTGALSRFSWQGLRVVRAIQQRLGADPDGKWGTRTNVALREKMRQLGMDPSVVRDGTVTLAMLQAALVVAYTMGAAGTRATAPAAEVCVPPRAVLPLWNTKPAGPDQSPDAAEVLLNDDGTVSTAAPSWRVPNGASILRMTDDAGVKVVVYRTSDNAVRRARVEQSGALQSDEAVPSDELVAMGFATAAPGDPAPTSDPSLPTPTMPPTRADAYGSGEPPATTAQDTRRRKILIGTGVGVGVLGVAYAFWLLRSRDQQAQAALPTAANPARRSRDSEPEDAPERPSQEDIDEGILIDQRADLSFTRSTFRGGHKVEETYKDDGYVAFMGRKRIAQAPSWRGLFAKLREEELRLGSPRIFQVNDHGNVNEYGPNGSLIGEWV